MAQQYYSLDEAAQVLGISPDELNRRRERGEIRAFADRGTWKFRQQDVQEAARQSGQGSDPDIPMADLSSVENQLSKGDAGQADEEQVLLSERELGGGDPGSSSTIIGMPPGGRSPSDSDVRLVPSSAKPGSDSDVTVVPQSGQATDSDVQLVEEREAAPMPAMRLGEKPGSDSDVRAVPAGPKPGGDSDVRAVPAAPTPGSDSDVRLVDDPGSQPTAEMRLDEEPSLAKGSDSDVRLVAPSDTKAAPPEPADTEFLTPDSDFELAGTGGEGDELTLALDEPAEDDSSLVLGGEAELSRGPADSGISLTSPVDSGISLEQPPSGSDTVQLELDKEDSFDTFDTDFEVPLLDEGDSGRQSDFELGTGDEESGSQVIMLDESESADADAATMIGASEAADILEAELAEDFDTGAAEVAEGVEEVAEAEFAEEEYAAAPALRAAAPAHEWGLGTVIGLGATTVVLMLVGWMMYDVVRNIWSWNEPTTLTSGIMGMFEGMFGQ